GWTIFHTNVAQQYSSYLLGRSRTIRAAVEDIVTFGPKSEPTRKKEKEKEIAAGARSAIQEHYIEPVGCGRAMDNMEERGWYNGMKKKEKQSTHVTVESIMDGVKKKKAQDMFIHLLTEYGQGT
ncbi:hypothetical protein ACJX0J_034867, partial [Zea mays]